MKYSPAKIERKWQRYWESKQIHLAKDKGKDNFMLLTEFPYPSGNLHVGHWYAFALPDILARYLKMNGHNVMYPIGFDAFGLPAENAAIQRNINPRDWTEQNIKYMTKQLKNMGTLLDWSREVSTINPNYYKWTQWMFLKFYEKGLVYRDKTFVNWCPRDKTVLANEQVVNGCCDRCGTEVVQKEITQWMFRTTAYADQLIDDIEGLDWPETTKLAQRNWIGRSEGAIIQFLIPNSKLLIPVFTTRADTLFGATYLVLAPEHPMLTKLTSDENLDKASRYLEEVKKKTELERLHIDKSKTGVDTGGYVVNPINNEKIPVWVADYVLGHYGTGAIMAVPAHDERDKEFAEKFNLPVSNAPLEDAQKIVEKLKEKGLAEFKKNYKLHDWVLSRQRYWGVPIPMIRCEKCGYVAVPEKELPVELPYLEDFKPSDDGRSPLAKAKDWLKVKCPECGRDAERETDTMDTFVDSSWYFLRYTDPKNKKEFASKKKMAEWLPVPMYIGGAEHNTMHLLYSRFFTKALHDLGYLDFNEPFTARRNHGIILGPDGQKMSKSRGNVVDPDVEVKKYGADTIRMYLAFMGPYDQGGPWNPDGIQGVFRFLTRVWNFISEPEEPKTADKEADRIINKATKEMGDDIKNLKFNTGVSGLMKLLNALEDKWLTKKQYGTFLKLLAPFAPHIAEELWWTVLKNKKSIHLEKWPKHDEALLAEELIELVIQINGIKRDVLKVTKGLSEEEVKSIALSNESVKKYLVGKEIKKFVYVKDRLTNIVI
ncbi:MAG: leucine--tRNA ligase [Candidatus Yanofskybacteria bacterium]|nr:leucine--tRNA ligase [Candidatus Yanofskybacteria bacterium]